MKPRFLIDPQVVNFPRKIITSQEKSYATTEYVILQNPEKRSVTWRIDDSSLQLDNEVFTIHPTTGTVDSG